MNAPPTDRVILAVTALHMEWEAADKNFTESMVEDTAKRWSLSEEEAEDIANFLCEFVMDMRADAEDDGFEGDED